MAFKKKKEYFKFWGKKIWGKKEEEIERKEDNFSYFEIKSFGENLHILIPDFSCCSIKFAIT